jgi:hypothetical protein
MSLALVQLAAQRALELRALVGPPDSNAIPEHASQQVMLNALRSAELDMLITLMYPTDEARPTTLVCGRWNTRDLTGHLADWDTYYLDCLAEIDGQPNPKRHWPDDIERKNGLLSQLRERTTFDECWSDYRHNRNTLISQLERIRPNRFKEHVEGSVYATPYHLAWSALEHFLEHAGIARREMQMPLPDALLGFKGPYTT